MESKLFLLEYLVPKDVAGGNRSTHMNANHGNH